MKFKQRLDDQVNKILEGATVCSGMVGDNRCTSTDICHQCGKCTECSGERVNENGWHPKCREHLVQKEINQFLPHDVTGQGNY